MAIQTKLTHVTRYEYDRPVTLGPQTIRLRPAAHSRSKVSAYALKVEPAGHFVNWQQDPHGNWVARFVFPEPTLVFSVSVDLMVEMAVFNPFDFFVEETAEEFPFAYSPELGIELAPYLVRESEGALFHDYLAKIPRAIVRTTDFIVELNRRLQSVVAYEIRMEPGVQTPEETL
ncbi:MAG TPA: transglutaminase N-terminal domain-containing protein, partial [Methylomirabilota bacterium]|nr:transglutaminase N-terminal domain-containing protein [Methylomirabilota bacterium]